MGLRIALIVRPRRDGEGMEQFRRVVAGLRGAGHRVFPHLTFEEGDAVRLARGAAEACCDLVLAAGGDGTVNEVVNGIAGCEWQPRLGIIPTGTANDFAAGMELPTEVEAAVEVAVRGRAIAVDVARVNDRRFLNVSTGGFGAEATDEAGPETKRRLGPWAYVIAGFRKFMALRPTWGRFHADGRTLYEGDFLFFAVGNARRTGGGTMVTPRAEFGDGKLDLLVVPALPRMDFLALIPDIRAGTHIERPDVLYLQTPTLCVEALEELSVNADGEPMRGRRFDYLLEPRPLSLMVP